MGGNWGGNGNGDGNGDNGGQPQLPPPQPSIWERRASIHAFASQDPCKARQVRTNQLTRGIANQACTAAYVDFMALTVSERESCPEAEAPECRALPNHHNWRCTFSCNVSRHSGNSTPSPRVARHQSTLARLFSCASGSSTSRRRREPDRVARSTSRGSRRERESSSLWRKSS
nr:PREDICTED: uncharacterized protein LOC109039319 [Bemisia tabaci]